jgi:hypothetical protein
MEEMHVLRPHTIEAKTVSFMLSCCNRMERSRHDDMISFYASKTEKVKSQALTAAAAVANARTRQGRVPTSASLAVQNARIANNAVKACLIESCTKACLAIHESVHVLDAGAGRGQDVTKWGHAIRHMRARRVHEGCGAAPSYDGYTAVDLACDASDVVKERMIKFPGVSASAHVGVDVCLCDWENTWLREATRATYIDTPVKDLRPPINIVSCQLAAHYFCSSKERIRTFFKECMLTLSSARHGLLCISFTDARAVIRRGRAAMSAKIAACPALGDVSAMVDVKREMLCGTIMVEGESYALHIPGRLLQRRLTSPYGNAYEFTMPDAVEGVTEYLCIESELEQVATQCGFQPAFSANFEEILLLASGCRSGASSDIIHPFQAIVRGMGANTVGAIHAGNDASGLYRAVVYGTTQEIVHEFVQACAC